jgi:hypothetical protein
VFIHKRSLQFKVDIFDSEATSLFHELESDLLLVFTNVVLGTVGSLVGTLETIQMRIGMVQFEGKWLQCSTPNRWADVVATRTHGADLQTHPDGIPLKFMNL